MVTATIEIHMIDNQMWIKQLNFEHFLTEQHSHDSFSLFGALLTLPEWV